MTDTIIYHITTADAWAQGNARGIYHADSLATDGFIHASTDEQILPVANRFYRAIPNLILLKIDSSLLSAVLRWEAPAHPDGKQTSEEESDTLFPHIYGGIDLDAVITIYELPRLPDGDYGLPVALNGENDN